MYRVVGADAEIATARSVDEALRKLHPRPDAVVCSVRFDESRMFDFLAALRDAPLRPHPRVACLRASPPPLAPAIRGVIEKALEALGIRTFVDFPELLARAGEEEAYRRLRAAILG